MTYQLNEHVLLMDTSAMEQQQVILSSIPTICIAFYNFTFLHWFLIHYVFGHCYLLPYSGEYVYIQFQIDVTYTKVGGPLILD